MQQPQASSVPAPTMARRRQLQQGPVLTGKMVLVRKALEFNPTDAGDVVCQLVSSPFGDPNNGNRGKLSQEAIVHTLGLFSIDFTLIGT
uniref:Uncharacterized protein n=1 Tax=Leersia perrieri TaxID=77586 RepID=A0A0D9XTH1_9ORYZ